MTTLHLTKSIGRSPLRLGLLLIAVVIACFTFSAPARAQLSPAPDGGYPGANTAEGDLALLHLTNGINNTALGHEALRDNTTGSNNTATGFNAMASNTSGNRNTASGISALQSNGTGSFNTASGNGAMYLNTTGNYNTATGVEALFNNTADSEVALGYQALRTNTTGQGNTAVGFQALFNSKTSTTPDVNGNTVGESNTAVGSQALFRNTTAPDNTAVGFEALFSNTTGWRNTAVGHIALSSNNVGTRNTAVGFQTLTSNKSGISNTAVGDDALFVNTTGNFNTATGKNALASNTTGIQNTACGSSALGGNVTGSNNIALGFAAGLGVTGSNNIDIGNVGVTAAESNTIRLGTQGTQTKTFIAGISGATASGGAAVFVNASGELGTITSSARFKDEIKPMGKASEAILALQPVTFRYKKELDPEAIPQFGLVAEEVEKVNRDLVARDAEGKPYTVRYEAVNAMLLNEFLKEHQTVQEQQKEIDALKMELKEQRALIQKVSDTVELNKPAPQLAANNQ